LELYFASDKEMFRKYRFSWELFIMYYKKKQFGCQVKRFVFQTPYGLSEWIIGIIYYIIFMQLPENK